MPSPKSNRASLPKKPYPGFPLGWHASGYWVKKIRGKLHYFGPRRGTAEQALAEYTRVRDDLHAGRVPQPDVSGLTLKDACNRFLADRETRLRAGDLTQRSWNDYHKTCSRLLKHFGPGRLAGDLKPHDFAGLRESMSGRWGAVTISGEVTRVRVLFKWLFESALIETPIRYGPAFKRPTARTLRVARASKGPRILEPTELRQLLAAADPQLRTMILLGLNAGLGNSDCARLTTQHLNLDTAWLNYPRPKTGIGRRAKLWPETVEAIRVVLAKRPALKSGSADLVFVTKYGGPWTTDGSNALSQRFRKLLDAEKLYRPGISFYTLRHVFQTIAGESKDQVAVGHVMGHVDASMAATYRERISNERIETVCGQVRTWLLEEGQDNE
jgi:integrase